MRYGREALFAFEGGCINRGYVVFVAIITTPTRGAFG